MIFQKALFIFLISLFLALSGIAQSTRIAYVSAKSGLNFREGPAIDEPKSGTFLYGTRVVILEETNIPFELTDNGERIKGQWVKVTADITSTNFSNVPRGNSLSGYVFDGFLADSSEVNFREMPIHERLAIVRPDYELRSELELDYEDITATQFRAFQAAFDDKISFDSTKREKVNASFILQTKDYRYRYTCNKNWSSCNYYMGKLEPLHLYITSFTKEIGELYLTDSLNNKVYIPHSPFDAGCFPPVISPKNQQLILYASSPFDREAFISLYQISPAGSDSTFNSYESFYTTAWRIAELVWIDESKIALHVFDDYGLDAEGRSKLVGERFLKAWLNP